MKNLAAVLCLLITACTSARPGIDSDSAGMRSPSEIVAQSSPDEWQPLDPDYTLYINTSGGRVVVALSPHLAKRHVAQIKTLARERYFDGLRFYRVIEGFVAQAGDPNGDRATGSAADSLAAEFDEAIPAGASFTPLGNDDGYADQVGFINGLPAGRDRKSGRVWLTHCTGALAFARGNSPNSASATIYITLQPQRYLDRNLTVVGRVVWGLEHVQSIHRAPAESSGIIEDPSAQTTIVSVRVASDLPITERVDLEMLDARSNSFRELVQARRNRPEEFFVFRPDYADLCQMPIPVRTQ